MKSKLFTAFLGFSMSAGIAFGQQADGQFSASQVERGSYLVNNIGMCGDCHSPRGQDGQLIPELKLKGAAIGFTPLMEMPWAPAAPPLAGLPPNYTSTQFITFLMTGQRPSAQAALPPMPEYRLSRDDAEAIAAYLLSLQ